MKRIVILGAGTAGTIMANRLSRHYKRALAAGEMEITIVDQDDQHIYQPGLLFIPFGTYKPKDVVRPRDRYVPKAVRLVTAEIDRVDVSENRVYVDADQVLEYDVLLVATGTRIAPEETEGLTGPGWQERMFEFYSLDGATALYPALRDFADGRLVVNVVDMPIKCPIAPLEFVYLADSYFTKRGIRDRVEISLVTPLDGAFTKPVAAHHLKHLLEQKNIKLVTEFSTGEVDGTNGRLVSWDEREVPFDLLVSIPLHAGQEFVDRSPGLGDDLGFVVTDPATLQAKVKDNVFAIGDATNVPTSKAGSVAHFEGDVLTENLIAYLDGLPLDAAFDGHANCFIETGFDKAVLIDFNYDVEPLPGKFPFSRVGPLSLLKESRLNHAGKMGFKWMYWNVLLPGRDIPGVTPDMSMAGKHAGLESAHQAA